MKMVFQLQQLNLLDPEVLREQLIGVDTTYMGQYIEAVKEYLETGEELTWSYMMYLIDEVFDTH